MNGVWPERCVPLAKKELRMVPFYGWVAWLTGAIFIDRLNTETAKGTIEGTVKILRDQNVSNLCLETYLDLFYITCYVSSSDPCLFYLFYFVQHPTAQAPTDTN